MCDSVDARAELVTLLAVSRRPDPLSYSPGEASQAVNPESPEENLMKRRTHAAAALLWALLAFMGLPGSVEAQGVVTGAISGRVSSPDGEGLAGAQVTIRN